MRRLRTLFSVLLAMPLYAFGQGYVYQTGNPTFSTQIPVEQGFINVNNGELHMEIPIASFPQRGGILSNTARLVYDSRIWKIVDNNGNYSWQPTNVANSMGGWLILTGGETGSDITYNPSPVGHSSTTVGSPNNSGGLSYCTVTQFIYAGFTWTDPTGTAHVFNADWVQNSNSCQNSGQSQQYGGGYAMDGSGLNLTISGLQGGLPTSYTIKDKSGTQLYPQVVDRNGNGVYLTGSDGAPHILQSQNGNQMYYDVLTAGGQRARYTITTEQINYQTQFKENSVGEVPGSFTAIQSLQLPDGSQYQFSYDTASPSGPSYGELTSVTLPTGGVVNYEYTNFKDSFGNVNRWISKHTADAATTIFAPSTVSTCSSSRGCQEKTVVTSPDGNDTAYIFDLDKGQIANAGSWETGVAVYQGAQSGGALLHTKTTSYVYQPVSYPELQQQLPQSMTVTDTLPDAGVSMQTMTSFDTTAGYVLDTKTWDYRAGPFPSQPDLDTAYTYNTSFPTQIVTKDGAGNLIASITNNYDESPSPVPASGGIIGNLTSQHQWINTTGQTWDTSTVYGNNGSMVSSTTPNGKTTYSYDPSGALVTSVTAPTPSSGAALKTNTSYDLPTGVVTAITDPNGQTTAYKNFDLFNRVREIDFPDKGVTTLSYPDPQTVSEPTAFNGSTNGWTIKQNDAYGRPSRVEVATGRSDTPWYVQDTCYDANGRVSFQSYRYQGQGFSSPKVCSGAGDSYAYDALGRVKQVTHGDGSTARYSYAGRATKVTDENGVSKITQVDGFGRVTAVCEISSNTTMPASSGSPASCGTDIAGTGFLTTYSSNRAAFQTTVAQGGQTRIFTTDSIGRQVSAQEPESGKTTWSYAYNGTGLLVTRQKGRANQKPDPNVLTTTKTQYDTLGRVVSVTYDDGTGAKSYNYDVAQAGINTGQTNLLGRLSQQAAQTPDGFAIQNFSYDPLGRTVQVVSCLPSNCGKGGYTQQYVWDYAGNMTQSTDGAGATLLYGYTPANELNGVINLQGGPYPFTLLSNVQHGPFGPTSYQLGNGLSQVYQYDGLGRKAGGWVCKGSTSPNCSGGTQVYGFTVGWNGGRVNQACDTVLGNCSNLSYDDMNRLTARTTTSGTNLSDSWTYDRWGNRWTQTAAPSGYQQQLPVNSANNQAVGFTYDGAGNLLSDGVHNYSYDAEGNLVLLDGGANGKYDFDASNHRIRFSSFGNTYELLYDLGGKRVAGFNANGGAVVEENAHIGALPLAVFFQGLFYEHQDWLGTERLLTDPNGNAVGSYASLPFGDGFQSTGDDLDPYHFAGMDHNYESGLEHATFRDYSSAGGRWLSPDPYAGSYDWTNPQSLNRYAYALNNPLSFVDPAGLKVVPCSDNADVCVNAPCHDSADATCGGGGSSDPIGFLIDLGEFIASFFGAGQPHINLDPRPTINPYLVPPNPCVYAGRALPPSAYATAGEAMNILSSPISFLIYAKGGFPRTKFLDAQPLTGLSKGPYAPEAAAYGNYVYGTYMAAAGLPLSTSLEAASVFSFQSGASYQPIMGPLDSAYPYIPEANVANITNGYNAQMNGTLCHP